jgi:hypothetical protein
VTTRGRRLAPLAVVALLVGGCATSAEWAAWRSHPVHFASNDHFGFSIRNRDSKPEVTRHDLVAARQEGWWGDPVTVAQNQIVER